MARRSTKSHADWRKLLPFSPRRLFPRELLLRTRRRRLRLVHDMLTVGVLSGWSATAWEASFRAMRRQFGLTQTGSLLAEPHLWTRFHEPQITGGFRHFLSSGPESLQLTRSRALLRALWGDALPPAAAQEVAKVMAEEGRIDLVVSVSDTTGRTIGAVVEAKFGHRLTPYQLQRYRRFAQKRWGSEVASLRLVVVMPELDIASRKVLRRNTDWHFLSWAQLLARLDNTLDRECDDEDFRRFRRTVWLRAYNR